MVFGVIVVVLRLLNTFVDSLVRKTPRPDELLLSVRIALVFILSFILLLISLLLLVIRSTLAVATLLVSWQELTRRYLLRLEFRCL